jgi:hypothetical protein
VRVNSVGTILAVKPRPTPQPKEIVAETGKSETKKSETEEIKSEESKKDDSKTVVSQISIEAGGEKSIIADTNAENKNERNIEVTESKNKLEVLVTENAAREENRVESIENENSAESETRAAETTAKTETIKPVKTRRTTRTNRNAADGTPPKTASKKTKAEIAAELNAALENIRLIVLMKDGEKIEKSMNEVLRFGVDKGVLTIIAKDGTINRYSILDVAKITIE